MRTDDCKCGHEKQDHRTTLGATRHGACKICLCNEYVKVKAEPAVPAKIPAAVEA